MVKWTEWRGFLGERVLMSKQGLAYHGPRQGVRRRIVKRGTSCWAALASARPWGVVMGPQRWGWWVVVGHAWCASGAEAPSGGGAHAAC